MSNLNSKLNEFRRIERQIAELLEAQEQLQRDTQFQADKEFAEKLDALVSEYGYTTRDVISIIAPELLAGPSSAPAKGTRRARVAKTYTNPHTGETVVTRGGNHRQLREWREKYGSVEVASWERAQ